MGSFSLLDAPIGSTLFSKIAEKLSFLISLAVCAYICARIRLFILFLSIFSSFLYPSVHSLSACILFQHWCGLVCGWLPFIKSMFQEWNINSKAMDSLGPQATQVGFLRCRHQCCYRTLHFAGSIQSDWFYLPRPVPVTYRHDIGCATSCPWWIPLQEGSVHWAWLPWTLQYLQISFPHALCWCH